MLLSLPKSVWQLPHGSTPFVARPCFDRSLISCLIYTIPFHINRNHEQQCAQSLTYQQYNIKNHTESSSLVRCKLFILILNSFPFFCSCTELYFYGSLLTNPKLLFRCIINLLELKNSVSLKFSNVCRISTLCF